MEAPPDHEEAQGLPENKDPEIVSSITSISAFILSNYGWLILACIVLLFYLKTLITPKLKKMKEKKEEMEYLNIDAETARKRFEARERAFNNLQDQHAAKVAKFAEEQAIKEEKKRQEKIDEWDKHQRGGGYHSKVKTCDEPTSQNNASTSKPKKTNTYRSNDFNPLMGNGGSGYRPSRRGGGG